MKKVNRKNEDRGQGWLLFFYSVPSKPVSNRMKIWRKLSKAGAVHLKGAVYILPFNDEHYEFLQWLVSEIVGMKGEGAYVKIEKVDTMSDVEIEALFNERQEGEYQAIGKSLDDLETRVSSIRKGAKTQDGQGLFEQLAKVEKKYEEALKTDFFSSRTGVALRSRVDALNTVIKGLTGPVAKAKPASVSSRKIEAYQGKIWVTRKKPFIDRMASAWLIKKYIDKDAAFAFADEKELETAGKNFVAFDVRGGEFTHAGDLCTFEVLLKSFGLKDKVLKKIAEIVHDLDMKDDKYNSAEAKGLEDILTGIRKTAKDDTKALEKGMAVFEMLYVSKS